MKVKKKRNHAAAAADSGSFLEKQVIAAFSSGSESALSYLLKILSSSPAHLPLGLQIHSLSLKLSLSSLPFPASSLIRFYSKHRLPSLSLSAFLDIPSPDHVCFSSLISAFSQNHLPSQSLTFFRRMLSSGLPSSSHSLSSALRSSASSASFDQTRILHSHSLSSGLLPNPFVSTSLIHSYAMSGSLPDALLSFHDSSPSTTANNLITWNVLLSAHAQLGDASSARRLFHQMLRTTNLAPDSYTFLALLSACANSASPAEAETLLHAMPSSYGVSPTIEHHSCLLASMARAGMVEEAERLASTMPFRPDAAVWRTLLSAAVVHGIPDVGRRAAGRLLDLDPNDDSAYVMLAKIFSSVGRKKEMAEVWVRMRDRGVRKEGGRSWVEVGGKVHVFVAGDRKHERSKEIYEKVRELEVETGKLGYEEKGGEGVWEHSERLAVAMCLIGKSSAEGMGLRVVKNLRICGDCHEFFKHLSRLFKSDIVVRDVNRYHRFQEGSCTCKDCW